MRRTASQREHADNEKRQGNIMKFRVRISSRGFTITELLVAMAISSVVMASIYSSFYSQQKSAVLQNEVAAMQQNLRSAMYFMEREIRMAGYNPSGEPGVGIQAGFAANTLRFTMDLNEDDNTDDPDEDITYSLFDSDGDGINDQLLRNDVNGSGSLPIANNIEALDFVYLDEGSVVTATQSEIRSVQITVVARADRSDLGYVNADSFTNQQGAAIAINSGDDRRRRILKAQVKCRNLGLE
jgi:type IV pilus assembly protein PilW